MYKSMNLFENDKVYKRKSVEATGFEEEMIDYLPVFKETLIDAFQQTREELNKIPVHHRDKNLPSVKMSGHIRGLLFERLPDYFSIDKNHRFRFQHPKYLIYFKKLKDDLRPCNIETGHTNRLMNQLYLPIEEPIPVLWAGYTVDKTGMLLTGLYVVCIDENQLVWAMDITHYGTDQLSIDLPKPIESDPDEILVQPKKPKLAQKSV